jgi:hypothetical protein
VRRYTFSLTPGQWWTTVAALVLLLVLTFLAGFLGGAMWQESRPPEQPLGPSLPG